MPGLTQVEGLKYYTLNGGRILPELPGLLPPGRVNFVTMHWTAGHYNQGYNDYQILVSDTGILVSCNPLNWFAHQHTWRANQNNIGLSLMCMAPGAPPTRGMVERAAAAVACLRERYALNSRQIKDHGQWAKEMGYWPDRVDVQTWPVPWERNKPLDQVIKDKSVWYLQQLRKEG